MAWQGILGVDEIALQFARASRRNRIGGSFLFVGPNGVGKRTFAFALAKTLLCRRHFAKRGSQLVERVEEDELSPQEALERFQPCGECECCKQFEWNVDLPKVTTPTHPDFHYVCKPADKSLLPLELLVGDKDSRSRSGLCFELNQTSFMGGRKVAVIDDADFFNLEGANALLKTLEEPPPNSIIILIGTSAAKQLPTIRSRCQTFRFKPLQNDDLASLLLKSGKVDSPEEADAVARICGGSIEEAEKALDANFSEFQATVMAELSRERIAGVDFAAKLNEFVDAAGKEAILRRIRLRNVFKAVVDFYREAFITLQDPDAVRSRRSSAAPYAKKLVARGGVDEETALDCVERTLDALEQIDRNANLPFIVDAWAYQIAELNR